MMKTIAEVAEEVRLSSVVAEASAAEAVASAEAASVEVWEVAEVPVPDSES
jgi:hypothetical protein